MPEVISIAGIIPPIKKSDDYSAVKRAAQLAVSFILNVATLWSSEALLAPKFTRQGRRTEKLQSVRAGMLNSVSITQQDPNRKIVMKAIAARLALMRPR